MAKTALPRTSPKDNSKRRYRGSGPRPDRNEQKRKEAQERQAAYAAIPLAEKLKRNLGAKERAKLEKRVAQ